MRDHVIDKEFLATSMIRIPGKLKPEGVASRRFRVLAFVAGTVACLLAIRGWLSDWETSPIVVEVGSRVANWFGLVVPDIKSSSPHQTATASPKTDVIKTRMPVAGHVGVDFIVPDSPFH